MTRLILASGSPRRRLLLSAAGFHFDVLVPEVDESRLPGEDAAAMVGRLARAKAAAVAVTPPFVVLAADTAVVIDGEVLGKPDDDEHAAAMLSRLSGRAHHVITGWCVRSDEGHELTGITDTAVTMRSMTEAEITAYVASGEPFDKAGAYALQGEAADFVVDLEGPRSNVIGLPLAEVVDALEAMGVERQSSR